MKPWNRSPTSYDGGRYLAHTPAADAATRERMGEREESSTAKDGRGSLFLSLSLSPQSLGGALELDGSVFSREEITLELDA
jgi:hypothetical protein